MPVPSRALRRRTHPIRFGSTPRVDNIGPGLRDRRGEPPTGGSPPHPRIYALAPGLGPTRRALRLILDAVEPRHQAPVPPRPEPPCSNRTRRARSLLSETQDEDAAPPETLAEPYQPGDSPHKHSLRPAARPDLSDLSQGLPVTIAQPHRCGRRAPIHAPVQ